MKLNFNECIGGMSYAGEVFIKKYEVKKTKNGSEYINGVFSDKDATIGFKVWNNSDAFESFRHNDLTGKVLYVEVTGNEYMGVKSYEVNNIKPAVECKIEDFKTSLDITDLKTRLENYVSQNLKKEYAEVLSVIFSDVTISQRFLVEQAASSVHDAVRGGLTNHVLKMLAIFDTLINSDIKYKGEEYQEFIQMMRLSIILHDIGKVYELNDGTYTVNSFVTHLAIGVEVLNAHKKEIVAKIGEFNYYKLISVIQGHHDEFYAKATSVLAYLTHYIDNMEAKFTSVMDKMVNDYTEKSNGVREIYFDERNLVI